MKKNKIFCMCAVAALVSASCQKAEDNPQTVNSVPVYLETIEAVSPSIPVRTMTNDGVNILWQDGDRIGLRPYTEGTASANGIMVEYETDLSSPSASATFVRVEGEEDPVALRNGIYIALYPSDPAYNNWSGQHDRTRVGIPYNQILPAGGGFYRKSSIMIATAAEGESLRFKHAMAYINFVVDSASPAFDRLVISSNSGTVLTDRIDLYYDATYEISSNNNYKSTSVTVTTEEASAFTHGSYYAAILPQEYAGGLTFTFYNGEEFVGTKSVDADVTFERGDVAELGTIGTFASAVDPLEVATVYAEDEVNLGVVFWVDPANPYKGKIVSGATTCVKWSDAVTTLNLAQVAAIDTDNSKANRDYIKALDNYNATNYPAVYFCAQLGADWYLPSENELLTIFKTYWGVNELAADTPSQQTSKDNAATFDALLSQCVTDDTETAWNEAKLDYGNTTATWYWTGQGKETTAQRIRRAKIQTSYAVGFANPTNECFVRCVRDIEIK